MADRSEYFRAYRAANAERIREYQAAYRAANRERLLEQKAKWYRENADHARGRMREYRDANREATREADRQRGFREPSPEKRRARSMVRMLPRPDRCSQCATVGPVQAHHDDYSKPLKVRWLCTACHGIEHRKVA